MTASVGGWVSPPELVEGGGTGTGSSKSSSLPSSFQLDDGSVCTNNLGDFEEIGLSDDHEDHHEHDHHNHHHHLTAQIASISMQKPARSSAGRQSMLMGGKLRDLTQMKRPSLYPSHQEHHLGPPPRRSTSTNGSRNPLLPPPPSPRTLSPGPPSAPLSPNMVPVSNGRQASPMTKPRRLSWQQASHRKTVEELENECDSDDDDDVPLDTIFYNIPISPRSAKALSAAASPERTSPKDPLPANGGVTSLPTKDASVVSILGELGSETRGRSQFQSKSWSHAIFELGDETKELSEALERHADEEIEQAARRVQKRSMEKSKSSISVTASSVPLTPVPIKKSFSTTTTVIPLPPLQMTNGMIDPLPISKEKEAVLSRTRPSWLPPKSKEEEKRHLREYKKMMRLSQEADRKRVEKERLEQEYKDRIKNDTDRVWNQHIIPNWSVASRENETRELWWQGVAPRCRGKVWQLSFGNNLAVGPETFRLALKRARDLEEGLKKSPTMYSFKERELLNAIRRDVNKTFTELKIFQEKGPLHQSLLEVLMAYSMYRSDVGYVFGTHVVAGLLLINLSVEQSFITLVNLLNRPLPLAFYTQDEAAMSRVYTLFLKAFRYKLPSLHQHIHVILNLPPQTYLEAMFLTLFALHCPIDITSRIWDAYSFEGDAFLVRTAVAVLTVLESRLYGDAEEVLGLLGWNVKRGWDLGKEDEFMAVVRAAGKEEMRASDY